MTDIVENLKKGQSLTFEESKSLFSNLMEGKFDEDYNHRNIGSSD